MAHERSSASNTAGHVSHFMDLGSTGVDKVNDELVASMSSEHIWQVLVKLLEIALQPLSAQSSFVDDVLYGVMHLSIDRRRKISALSPEQTIQKVNQLLDMEPHEKLNHLFHVLGVERGFLSQLIEDYLSGHYQPVYRPPTSAKEPYFEEGPLSVWTAEHYSQYFDFRNRVIARYQNLTYSQADKNQWSKASFGMDSDKGDQRQNYILSVFRAIDKFHPGKGTLTAYIMTWFSNAPGSYYTMYTGEAYGLRRAVRHSVHKGDLKINNKGLEIADEVLQLPSEGAGADTREDDRAYCMQIADLYTHPAATLAALFSGFILFPTDELLSRVDKEMKAGKLLIPRNWKPPPYEIQDIPLVKKPQRAQRTSSSAYYNLRNAGKPS